MARRPDDESMITLWWSSLAPEELPPVQAAITGP
jgi:hypothetical protein